MNKPDDVIERIAKLARGNVDARSRMTVLPLVEVETILSIASDRDVQAAEVERLKKLFDDAGQGEHNVLALIDHYQDAAIAAESRADQAEAEVERLRAELERAAEQVDAWKDASGLECGGDPDGVTPAAMKRYWESVECRAEQAEARVRELEGRLNAITVGSHTWVPIAECGELVGRFYVQNDDEEGMCVFKSGEPTGAWRGVKVTHVLSPSIGTIPEATR